MCKICGTHWYVAEEGRIYDVCIVTRSENADLQYLRSYRGLLAASRDSGATVHYDTPMVSWELPAAIKTLADETPNISLSDLTALLPIDRAVTRHHATYLIKKYKTRINLDN